MASYFCKYMFRHGPFDIQGGGPWVFGPGREIFFGQNRKKIITKNYIYDIKDFATTLCLIQALVTTSCFHDNLIPKFKSFATNSHSIQVSATTADCSRNIVNLTLFRFSSQLHTDRLI